MQITVAPASPKTGQAAIESLLELDETVIVRGVYRNLSKVPTHLSSHPRFRAIKGDLNDAVSLDFTGADAVLAITPPRYDGADILQHASDVSENTKLAVQRAGTVKRVVLVSSIGAQYDHGTGEILTNHRAEAILQDAADEVVFVRCAYFMENWAMSLPTVESDKPFFNSTITPLDYKIPMIAVRDIGKTCAYRLLAPSTAGRDKKPTIIDLRGPQLYSPQDVKAAFESASGKNIQIKPVLPAELNDFFCKVFPPNVVDLWVEMAKSFLPGGISAGDIDNEDNVEKGKTTLDTAIKEVYANATKKKQVTGCIE